MIFLQANCGVPDQTSLIVASALGLQYLLTAEIGLWVYISASKLHVDPDQTPLIVASALGLHYYIQEMNSGLILVRYKLIFLQENCGDPDQTLLTVASPLGLHNLPTAKSWTLGLYWLGTK